jgi:hypothetical protein
MSCIGRFAEVRILVAQAGVEKWLLGFPAHSLVAIPVYAMLSRLPSKVNARKLQLSLYIKASYTLRSLPVELIEYNEKFMKFIYLLHGCYVNLN